MIALSFGSLGSPRDRLDRRRLSRHRGRDARAGGGHIRRGEIRQPVGTYRRALLRNRPAPDPGAVPTGRSAAKGHVPRPPLGRPPGGRAVVEVVDGVVYLAMLVRNVGSGMAVIESWEPFPGQRTSSDEWGDIADFRPQTRALWIAPSDVAFWQGAMRDETDPLQKAVAAAVVEGALTVDLLYRDPEGGQRTAQSILLHPSRARSAGRGGRGGGGRRCEGGGSGGRGDRRARRVEGGLVGIPVMAPHLRADMNDHTHGAKGELGIPDLVGPDLRVLFCGINPGQRSGEARAAFRPGGKQILEVVACGGLHGPRLCADGAGCPPGARYRYHQPGRTSDGCGL